MQMLGGRSGGGGGGGYSGGEAEYGGSMPSQSQSAPRPAPAKKAPSCEDMDDDIPF